MSTESIAVFFGVLIVGLLLMAFSRSQWADQLTRLGKHQERMKEKFHEVSEINIFLAQKEDYLAQLLSLCGLEAQYAQMRIRWIIVAIVASLAGGGMAYTQMPELTIIGIVVGAVLGAGGFVAFLKFLAKQRQAKLTEQLPQTLETMASSLRAGSPVMEVFKVLSESAVDPIRSEFKRGLVSLQLGKPFRDVLHEMSQRIRTPDFKLLIQAIFISQDVGGNLADVVATIADTIRERFKLRDFMNSLTSQGKATAMFIGCLPYGITLFSYMMMPGYMTPFLNNPLARIVLAALVVWEFIGFWILIKMTTFEV